MKKIIQKNWKQTLWKTINVFSSIALIANMSMIGVFIAPKVASASTTMGVQILSWNIVGVDSNRPVTDGPHDFLVQARVTNAGASSATSVQSTFAWGSGTSYLSLVSSAIFPLNTINSGASKDVFYVVRVTPPATPNTPSNDVFGKTRPFTISISSTDAPTVSAGQTMTIQSLNSQNRNSVQSATVSPASPLVGQPFTVTVVTHTTGGGNFLDVSPLMTYAPSLATLDSVTTHYEIASPPTNPADQTDIYAQDVGGTMTSVFHFRATAAGTQNFYYLIYDHSGGSYHYNSDFGGAIVVPVTPRQNLTKTVNKATAAPGDAITYTLNYFNTGNIDLANVVITETYDSHFTFSSSTPIPSSSNNVWNIGTLLVGAGGSITINGTLSGSFPNGTTKVHNVATMTTTTPDVPPLQATADTNVSAACNLTIVKSVDNLTHPTSAAQPGDTLKYSLVYKNTGNANCTGGGVRIDDIIPTGTTYVNPSNTQSVTGDTDGQGIHFGYTAGKFGPDNAGFNGTMLSWNGHVVSPNEQGTVTFKVTINALAECQNITIKNTGKIYSNEITNGVTSNEVQTSVTAPCSTTLKVIKHVVNNYGGTKTAGDFTMHITDTVTTQNFAGSESGTTKDVTPGTYNVTEDSVYGYAATYSADCSGTITLGQDKVCTVTNNDIKPKLTVTKIVINDNGGTAKVSDFPLFVDTTSVTSGIQNAFNAGTYTVSETNLPGYTSAINGDCAANGSVTLNVGDVKSCTITNNDKAAKLVVTKHVINDNGGTKVASDFTMNVTGSAVSPASFAGNEGGSEVTLNAGSYSVDESAMTGYAKTLGANCSGTIANGETKYCTITNDDIQPKLTVTKIVVNDNGGTAVVSDFPLFVDKTSVTSGVQNGFDAATYTVNETNKDGYSATISGDCAENGSITLKPGDVKSCTITNNDVQPKLTVTKVVVNDNGGTAVVADFPLFVGQTSVNSGVQNGFNAGNYSISETEKSGYAGSISGDCDSEGNVSLKVGDTKACTITNDDIAPKLKLIKTVTNDNGGTKQVSDFPLFINGNPVTSGEWNTLTANVQYTASETTSYGYQASVWNTDCNRDGTITLQPGDTKVCTITNNDIQPKLTVTKVVVNDNGGTAVVADFPLFVGATSVTSGVQNGFDANTYVVSETNKAGYSASVTGDCDEDGNITLVVGDVKSCTITNDDQTAHLILNKIVDNNGVGTADKEDWNLAADGPTPIDGDGYVSEDVNTGTYDLSESGPTGFTASKWDCEGGEQEGNSISLALGESATCAITNTGIRGHVSGTKFEDKNGNGAFDAGDTAVASWPISLYINDDDSWELVGTTTTDINGHYEFNDLGMGEYKVSENPLLPWIPVIPTIDSDGFYAYTFTVAPGSDYQYDFLNYRLGSISGFKFNDLNGNGVWNTDEPGIHNWPISLTGPKNVGPVYTDQNGYYEFDNLPQGEYTVTEDTANTAWTNTTPSSIGDLNIADSNTNLEGNNFGNFKLGKISGYKYDNHEQGLPGWQICLVKQNTEDFRISSFSSVQEPNCTVTDETGYYEFNNLTFGTYVVSETLKPGWVQLSPTDPNTYTVNVISGTDSHNDFVNRMNEFGVSIEKTGPATVNAGDQMTYTLDWSITGNTPVTNAKVTDVLPANTTFVSADNGGTFDSTTKTITWDLGTVTPAISGTVHMVVKTVSPLDNGTVIENTGKICGTGTIPQILTNDAVQQQGTEKCDTSTTTTTTKSAPVLGISKTNDKPVGLPGDKVNYTIKWSVDGNAKATNVTITDTVPVELTIDTSTISNSGTYNASTRIITWNLGTQVPHAEGTVTYSGNIVSPLANGTQIVNITKITSSETDPKFWQSESTTIVKSAPVLVITKVVTPTETVAGTQVTYTVVIKNTGNDAAVNVKMTDLLPAGFTFVEFGGSSHTYTLGNLAAGAQTTVTYKVNISKDVTAGSYDNLAVASADNHSNVTAKATVKIGQVLGVEALPKLTITKTADKAFINPGGHVTYHVTITNIGDAPAINVQLQDVMPAGFTFDVGGITKMWSLGDLAVGASVKVVYTALADNSVLPGNYENIAVAWSDNNDKVTATVPVEVRKIQVLGAELPNTGAGIQDYIYFFAAGMLLLFSLYLLSLTFKKESD